jgi:lysophospholipase L1-like esterase
MIKSSVFLFASLLSISVGSIRAADPTWMVSWAASSHGPYPAGNAVAQPDLHALLPSNSANDQTFRLIVKPDLFGPTARLRFSNVFGSEALTVDGVYVGVHASGGSIIPGTNVAVRFNHGRQSITIEPGKLTYSDPVDLTFRGRDLTSRKLAVSFHVAASSGPMTWHAKGLTTSYLSPPHSGPRGSEESNQAFPFTTTSWYFLDAVEMSSNACPLVIAAFGDSITDGTNSTINGDDRWPDFVSQRLHAKYGETVSVVNAGIGGNQVVGPATYDKAKPISGGPSALERLDRDLLSLSGLKTVIWLEGINDLGTSGATPEAVITGFREGVARLHARGIRVIGATITSSLNSTATHGTAQVDARRKTINEFIRHGGVFDGFADFDAATLDRSTGALRQDFRPGSSTGGPGDGLHPNRAGYQAMANAVDLSALGTPGCH